MGEQGIERRLVGGHWRTVRREEDGANGGSQPLTSPLDIDGCVLWLDAATLPGANGDPVASWPDSSTSGFDAVQATANNRPTLSVVGGVRGVAFDPAAIALTPQFLEFSGDALDMLRDLDGISVAVVGKGIEMNAASVNSVLFFSEGVDVTRSRLSIGPGFQWNAVDDAEGGGSIDPAPTGYSDTTFRVPLIGRASVVGGYGVCSVGPLYSTPEDADDWTVAGNSFSDTPSLIATVGSDQNADNFEGTIHTIIVYNRALTATEHRLLYEYLSEAWDTL